MAIFARGAVAIVLVGAALACSKKTPSISVPSSRRDASVPAAKDAGATRATETDDAGDQNRVTPMHDAGATTKQTPAADVDAARPILRDLCALDHGNCDPATSCGYDAGAVVCGPCPAGYVGSGETRCTPASPVSMAASGAGHACVLLANRLKCWGDNAHGQLGLGDANNRGDEANEMGDALQVVDLGSGRSATLLALGAVHSCALLDDGSAKCWGDDTQGELGLGDTQSRGGNMGEMGDALPVVKLGSGRTPIGLALGANHSCAVFDDGAVKCWGDNTQGELGLGDTQTRGSHASEMGDALPAVDLGKDQSAQAIAAGDGFSCTLLHGGHVKCWGRNDQGQLGLGDTRSRGALASDMGDALVTVDLGSGRVAMAIAAGTAHACALLDSGDMKCWGRNAEGELGQGDVANRGDQPGELGDHLMRIDLAESVLAIAAGGNHSCALLDGGAVKCWGANADGELGQGDTNARGDGPGELGASLGVIDLGDHQGNVEPRSAIAIAAGSAHSCALLSNGALKCWGRGQTGVLGQGDGNDRGDQANEMGDALPAIDFGN